MSGAGNDEYDPHNANSGTPGATGNYALSFSLSNDDPTGLVSGATDINFGDYNVPYTIEKVLGTDNNNTSITYFPDSLTKVNFYPSL